MLRLASLACFALLWPASSVRAQDITDAGRFGLSSTLVRFESASAAESEAATHLMVGVGAPGMGLSLGLATSETLVLGASVMLAHESIESPSGASQSATAVQLLPELRYVFTSSGSTRGYVALLAGVSHAASGGAGITSFLFGPAAGAHFFVGPHASLDLGVYALYLNGSASGSDASITGASLGVSLGVSAWFGGATEELEHAPNRGFERTDAYSRPSAPAPTARVGAGSAAERTFDPARSAFVLRARFDLGSIKLLLVSMPQSELDTIYTELTVPPYVARPEQCTELLALINQEPIAAAGVTKVADRMTQLGGRLHFERFKTLGRRHATFGVQACGYRWELAPEQMPDLLKFLELVSQAATDVQEGRLAPLPTAAPVPVPVPEPAPQAPPAPATPPGTSPTPAAPEAPPPATQPTPVTPAAPAQKPTSPP